MALTHLWYTCCIGDAGENWDVAAVPSYEGTTTANLNADTFRVWKGTKNPEAAFEVLSYLIGEGSLDLLSVYGGMPARIADQDAFFATLDEKYPQGVNWDVAKAGMDYADIPSNEAYTPGYLEMYDRVNTFNYEAAERRRPGCGGRDREAASRSADHLRQGACEPVRAHDAWGYSPQALATGWVRRGSTPFIPKENAHEHHRRALQVSPNGFCCQAGTVAAGPARGNLGLCLHFALDHRLSCVYPASHHCDTHLHLHQHEAGDVQQCQLRGGGELRVDVPRRADVGVAGGHPQIRPDRPAGRDLLAAPARAVDEPKAAGRQALLPHGFLLPLHHSVCRCNFGLGRHAQPGDGLDQSVPASASGFRTRRTG